MCSIPLFCCSASKSWDTKTIHQSKYGMEGWKRLYIVTCVNSWLWLRFRVLLYLFRHCLSVIRPFLHPRLLGYLWCFQEHSTLSHPQARVKLSHFSTLLFSTQFLENSGFFLITTVNLVFDWGLAKLPSSEHLELLAHHSYQDSQISEFLGLSSSLKLDFSVSVITLYRSASFIFFFKSS